MGRVKSMPSTPTGQAAQPVYLTISEPPAHGIDLFKFWGVLVVGKWLIIGSVMIFAVLGCAYSLLAAERYRAEVVIAPVKEERSSGAIGGFGALASLAGWNLNDSSGREAVAMLGSKKFIRDFIGANGLLPALFAEKWDATAHRWKPGSRSPEPDVVDGAEFFFDHVLTLTSDRDTGYVTLAVEWEDPKQAADWATKLVVSVNETKRRRDLDEAQQKLDYLADQLKTTALLESKQAISRLIEEQINAMTIAHARSEYAFRVIDPAIAPKRPTWPQPTLIVIAAAILGGLLGVLLVLLRSVRGS
jgi:uncharacterized protein involved in exopolysaccharide biosynthesis